MSSHICNYCSVCCRNGKKSAEEVLIYFKKWNGFRNAFNKMTEIVVGDETGRVKRINFNTNENSDSKYFVSSLYDETETANNRARFFSAFIFIE